MFVALLAFTTLPGLADDAKGAQASTQSGAAQSAEPSSIPSMSKAVLDGLTADTSNEPTAQQLEQLERDAFSHAYANNTPEQRICRLEHFVFGKQSKGELSPRFKKLRSALQPKEPAVLPSSTALQPNPTDNSTSNSAINPNAATSTASSTTPKTYEFPTFVHKGPDAPPPVMAPQRHLGLIDVMNRGIDSYNAHRYTSAEDDFEECCAMAPGMSRCFSYLAITKMQLNLRQAAIDAFRTSFMLDPFGTYGRYAKDCLLVLAGDEAMRKGPPVDSKQVLDIAMRNIDKQSADISGRHQVQANQFVNSGVIYQQDYSMIDSRIRSNNARIEGALRAAHTVESANNLKHMLAVKKMPGDANLRAWGTTLTTRYYGNETYLNAPYYIPKERPMELKAIVQSLQSMKKRSTHASPMVHKNSHSTSHSRSNKKH